MNLTLLHFPEGTKGGVNGTDWAGLHHFGFIVDDKEQAMQRVEQNGGEFFMELPAHYEGVGRRDEIQRSQRRGLRHFRTRLEASQKLLIRGADPAYADH